MADPGYARGSVRLARFIAPFLCLFSGLGLSLTLSGFSEASRSAVPWAGWAAVGLVILLGRVGVGRAAHQFWRTLSTGALAALWLAATGWGLWLDWSAIAAAQPASLRILLAYLWRLSLALGLLALLWRGQNSGRSAALSVLALPGFSALIAGHPQAAALAVFPLWAALAYCPGPIVIRYRDWKESAADLFEMASLQAVGQTVVWSLANPVAELEAARYLGAMITFLGSAIFGWLGSGLLWGAAVHLRRQPGRRTV